VSTTASVSRTAARPTDRTRSADARMLVAFGITIFVTVLLGVHLHLEPQKIAIAWPGVGVALGWFVLRDRRLWPAMALVHFLAAFSASAIPGDLPVTLNISFNAASTLEAVVGAWFLGAVGIRPIDMTEPRHVVALAAVVAIVSPLTAMLAVAPLATSMSNLPELWLQFWIVDGVGIVIVVPAIVTATSIAGRRLGRVRLVELAMLFVATAVVTAAAIRIDVQDPGSVWAGRYLVFPFMALAAFRFGPLGAASTSLVMSSSAIGTAILSSNVLEANEAKDAVLSLQVFICFVSLSASGLAILDSKRRSTQVALSQAHSLLGNVIASSPMAIIALDKGGAVSIWNRAAESLFEVPEGDTLGRSLSNIPSIGWALGSRIADALRGQETAEADISVVRRSGETVTCLASFAPVRDDSGSPAGAIVMLSDLTERTKLEAQLRQLQKMDALGMLASGVAHDFNNILSIILGYGSILLRRMPEDDSQREKVEGIADAARRGAALTRQLLAFARPQTFHIRVVNLNDQLEDARELLRRLLREDIELHLELGADVGAVRIDPALIDLVVMNLVINARDAMESGGQVTVRTDDVVLERGDADLPSDSKPGRYAVLTVDDTGCGMSPETMRHVFDPFFTTKEVGKGTGLGLAMVFAAVRQSEGFVHVQSREGHGTSFTIHLPVTATAAEVREPSSEPGAIARGAATILVVEDEDEVRKVVVEALVLAGYRTHTASKPSDALALNEQLEELDLVISDGIMPEMSGPALVERLLVKRRDLRVLYISGYADDRVEHNVSTRSSFAFLQKPFDGEALIAKVDAVLAGKAETRAERSSCG